MKTFLHNHKVLVIALAVVLSLGVLSGIILGAATRFSAGGESFTTFAEAKEAAKAAEPAAEAAEKEKTGSGGQTEPEPAPTPSPAPSELSADEIKMIAENVQFRRSYIIPIRSKLAVADNKFLWTEEKPEAAQKENARSKADAYCGILFGKTFGELTGTLSSEAKVQLFQDTTDDRDGFLRVTDAEGDLILTLHESSFDLICADLLTYPEGESVNREKENLALAEQLGYTAKLYRLETGISHEIIYAYKTDTDTCLTFAYIGDKLWQVAVFPDEQAMTESEYFLADVQFTYREKAYPKNFVEAEPPAADREDMVSDRAIVSRLSRLYRSLSGKELDRSKLTATFYRDKSGAREDCWKIAGEGFDVVVSAYSRNVITFSADIPCKDLLSIPYEKMGGEEYESVTAKIANDLIVTFGDPDKELREISLNAVYDYHYCTMDIVLADGTWYECYFRDGVLKEIWYFANEKMYWVGLQSGWVADAVCVNAATGKRFIPDYRDWDGNLYVKQAPASGR